MNDSLADLLPCVYRFAMHLCGDSHLAEDIAQEAAVRAIRNPPAPVENSGTSPNPYLKIWLLRVTQNLWRDHCRRKQLMTQTHIELESIAHPAAGLPSYAIEQSEEVAGIVSAMHQLPERQRAVLQLVACEQLSLTDVAQILDITPEAVRSSISIARSKMRGMIYPISDARPTA